MYLVGHGGPVCITTLIETDRVGQIDHKIKHCYARCSMIHWIPELWLNGEQYFVQAGSYYGTHTIWIPVQWFFLGWWRIAGWPGCYSEEYMHKIERRPGCGITGYPLP